LVDLAYSAPGHQYFQLLSSLAGLLGVSNGVISV